jgi:N-acetylglucosaminyldiphosphoundecaprenol N-acetyl-beta-D-mannosaminyltransferase
MVIPMVIPTEYLNPPFVQFMNTKINIVNYCDVHESILNVIAAGGKGYICLTDVGNVISAINDEQLQHAINASFLSLADGTPLAYYARLAGYHRIERISGVQLMQIIFEENPGFSHYLLGDTEQTINNVIEKARALNKGIKITGYSPPFKEFTEEDNCEIVENIHKANPDIIWVCFGGGKQEKWMENNIGSIEKGIMIGVGSALRWYTGEIKSPPVLFQKLCLQWLFRLMSEFKKEPQKGKDFFVERQLKKFPIFLMHFPAELAIARRAFHLLECSDRKHLSHRCGTCIRCHNRVSRSSDIVLVGSDQSDYP